MTPRSDFVIIGAPKAGTTWCHDFLDCNEAFFVPSAKDTYFFDRHFERGHDWYERHFADAPSGAFAGEVCHDYLYSAEALERIAAYYPSGIRTVLVLREPSSRSVSHLKYSFQLGNVDSLDEAALEQNPNIVALSRYENFLGDVQEHLGANLSILFYEQLANDPERFGAALAEACSGTTPDSLQLPGRSNASGRARSRTAARAAKRAAHVLDRYGARSVVGTLKSSKLRTLLFDSTGAPQVDEATTTLVAEQLADSRRATVAMLLDNPNVVGPIPEAWLA